MRILPLLFMFSLLLPATLPAQSGVPEAVEVTAPGNRQLKLAIELPRNLDAAAGTLVAPEMGDVIAFDMNMSGVISAETRPQSSLSGGALAATAYPPWAAAGFDLLVRGEYSIKGDNLTVEYRLFDVVNRKMMTARRYLGSTQELRHFAHAFADEILLVVTGEKGTFTTHIAHVSTQTGNKEIVIMDWDGHNLIPLTRNGSINLNPDFSPDGREIIFSSYKRGNPDLYRRALSNAVEVPLSSRKGLNITGAWSPDGSRIALALSKDGDAEIYTVARDGSNPNRLTKNQVITMVANQTSIAYPTLGKTTNRSPVKLPWKIAKTSKKRSKSGQLQNAIPNMTVIQSGILLKK